MWSTYREKAWKHFRLKYSKDLGCSWVSQSDIDWEFSEPLEFWTASTELLWFGCTGCSLAPKSVPEPSFMKVLTSPYGCCSLSDSSDSFSHHVGSSPKMDILSRKTMNLISTIFSSWFRNLNSNSSNKLCQRPVSSRIVVAVRFMQTSGKIFSRNRTGTIDSMIFPSAMKVWNAPLSNATVWYLPGVFRL